MNNKSSCSPGWHRRARKQRALAVLLGATVAGIIAVPRAAASNGAPQWMHALVTAPLPAHDQETDAVELYSEKIVTVQSADKIKTLVRNAYKILRPGGRELGTLRVGFDSSTKINSLHAWCIPAEGKDYEVKDRDVAEVSILGEELVSDLRAKVVRIPAADPGSIIGYEYEQEDRPFVLQDIWYFQKEYPVRESHYTLQLPAGWEYKATWLNHSDMAPVLEGSNQWSWTVTGVSEIKDEHQMPPYRGIAGQVIVSFFPPGGLQGNAFLKWRDMGIWYNELTRGRRDASPEIKEKVRSLTASETTSLGKMEALANFVQTDIRYVAIELGIGGYQPHAAADVFNHRYGDCKDKTTLMSSMLKEIGIESYYVIINTERGSITPQVPVHVGGFDHAIIAIRLPDDLNDPTLVAVVQHPNLGRLLFFDPTDELTPLGTLRGVLQANYGLLVTPEGGELTALPQLSPALNGVQRSAKLELTSSGTLSGNVSEIRVGDRAAYQRYALRSATKETDKIKPIEALVGQSLSAYRLTKASVTNLNQTDKPFGFTYSLIADNYAKSVGNLLLVRPRVIGLKSSDLLETKEPRRYPVVFDGPSRDTDTFEITIPPGYEVDDLPPPVTADYGFAVYNSQTEAKGNVLRYTRTFEVKQVDVPLSKVEDLKKLYRIIASDERNTAVLKPTGS